MKIKTVKTFIMLKVICIDDSNQPLSPFLKEGEIYTALEMQVRPCGECYRIAEFETPEWISWCRRERFIPLSEINETQMERKYDKIKVL